VDPRGVISPPFSLSILFLWRFRANARIACALVRSSALYSDPLNLRALFLMGTYLFGELENSQSSLQHELFNVLRSLLRSESNLRRLTCSY